MLKPETKVNEKKKNIAELRDLFKKKFVALQDHAAFVDFLKLLYLNTHMAETDREQDLTSNDIIERDALRGLYINMIRPLMSNSLLIQVERPKEKEEE
jgi:hypothetical protein